MIVGNLDPNNKRILQTREYEFQIRGNLFKLKNPRDSKGRVIKMCRLNGSYDFMQKGDNHYNDGYLKDHSQKINLRYVTC